MRRNCSVKNASQPPLCPDGTTRQFITLANLVSLSRIILLPLIIYLLIHHARLWALTLIIVSYITDLVDGYLARKLKQESYYGRIIDPLTDKISLAAIVITLHFTDLFPLWAILFIVVRDILILIGSLVVMRQKEFVLPSNIPGKITGFIFGLLVFIYLLRLDFLKLPLLYITAALIIVSFIYYLRNGILTLRR